jgi:hypothetical protein
MSSIHFEGILNVEFDLQINSNSFVYIES